MQGRYWLLTIPQHDFIPYLPTGVAYLTGQLERGTGTGYLHWQLLCAFSKHVRLAAVKKCFGDSCHAELSRSDAADSYVSKADTRVEGTQFTLGVKAIKRNCARDWELVWESAKRGRFLDIPADLRVQHYRTLRTIASDFAEPAPIVREVFVFWGDTGLGKSRRAWEEAGLDSYSKDPRSKFWDGYRGHKNVVIDEFRGAIDIAHLLRWCDRYPVNVEIKGSSTPLLAEKIWITSNLHPSDWYRDCDLSTMNALLRRLNITHFDKLYF